MFLGDGDVQLLGIAQGDLRRGFVEGTRERNQREELLQAMWDIIQAKTNDAVKLAYLSEEQVDEIDGLDLRAITEFKRNGKGAVEVKFNDKMKMVEQILAQTDGKEDGLVDALLAALGGGEHTP